jgi:hypothetical protein
MVCRHLPGWKRGYKRDRVDYSPAVAKRVLGMRARGSTYAEIARELVRDGHEPIGECFWPGTISRIVRVSGPHALGIDVEAAPKKVARRRKA